MDLSEYSSIETFDGLLHSFKPDEKMHINSPCDEHSIISESFLYDEETFNKKQKTPAFSNHKKWTENEDARLINLVKVFGRKNWPYIAKGMGKRNSRQCRERWNNYLNPKLNFDEWTKEEDELIIQKRRELGPKWVVISKFFNNRTDSMIKTRYNALIRNENRIKNEKINIFNYLSDFENKKSLHTTINTSKTTENNDQLNCNEMLKELSYFTNDIDDADDFNDLIYENI